MGQKKWTTTVEEKVALGGYGHDYIDSSFSPFEGRSYLWFRVRSDATVTYQDASGKWHTSKALLAGEEFDCSGAAPTVASGEIVAWIEPQF